MDHPSASMRELARRLLELEAASERHGAAPAHEAVQVCEKLRGSLTRLTGADGFSSLLRRTLALARAEVPALDGITVTPDCSMDGLEKLAVESRAIATDAGVALTAHLLGLLVTFIGEPLTLRVVRDTWPDSRLDQ